MNHYFCSDHSRQAGEDIIGSATNYPTYILIECPLPWDSEAFYSKKVPENLKNLVADVKRAKLPVRFLLIANSLSHKVNSTTVLIYDKKSGLTKGYQKYEYEVADINNVAGIVRKWLSGETLYCDLEYSDTRDILVCTHGSRDKCCARYGNPFFMQALATVYDLQLHNVRIWKSSHFGGHRFAPTAIDLPDGRYYGALDAQSFKSILTRKGDIQCLNKVYRGLGIIPTEIQVMERELILRHGWDWFKYKVAGRILEHNLESQEIIAEITCEKPDGSVDIYRANLVKDESKTMQMKGACNASKESVFVKYAVENLRLYGQKVLLPSDMIA
jgi:hypothetical protein